MTTASTLIFQSAKLGDVPYILEEFARAERLLQEEVAVGRIYGVSGGALVALAFGLALAARRDPARWGRAHTALADFAGFLRASRSRHIRRLNLNPLYGFYNLSPLRRWVAGRLRAYVGRDDLDLSDLGIPLYLCAMDRDGTLTLFGPPDGTLHCRYQFVRLGPPRNAPLLDALIAALSTVLSTAPALVLGEWFRDCRPAIVDAGALVADLEAAAALHAAGPAALPSDAVPGPIRRTVPHAPIRPWKLNWITSSFIMHSQHERNQTLLAAYYLDLLERHRALQSAYRELSGADASAVPDSGGPQVEHIYLPYIGSTEALTNMRQSAKNKDALLARFRDLLRGQLDGFAFGEDANVIYGAGGFSGILGGLVTTRAVDAGFERGGGHLRQVYGVSAGVLNGFFHAVQLAAARHPDLYTPSARRALGDLESFFAHIEPRRIMRLNRHPAHLWRGFANLGPLERFLCDRLAAYTGSNHPEQITFDDIALPLTVAVARRDGYTDFLGMTSPARHMSFGAHTCAVLPARVVPAIIAGWSMNTYIMPTTLGDQTYTDGGGTFYDPGLFVACLDAALTNLLNIHLDEPEGGSYGLPPRPHLVRIVFDTHNYSFPEERRRMRLLVDLLYRHYRLRARYAALPGVTPALPPDFRRAWTIAPPKEL